MVEYAALILRQRALKPEINQPESISTKRYEFMHATMPTIQELLAVILGIPAPQTKIEEIELACLALMGDKNIRPIDKPDIYCAKLRLANEPTPSFVGGSTTSPEKIGYICAISILNQYREILFPDCTSS